jgi:Mitochondrial carrier protein
MTSTLTSAFPVIAQNKTCPFHESMNNNHARLSPALVETIAGLTAGVASTLAAHPLDVIKTRLQSRCPLELQNFLEGTNSFKFTTALL